MDSRLFTNIMLPELSSANGDYTYIFVWIILQIFANQFLANQTGFSYYRNLEPVFLVDAKCLVKINVE